MCGFHPRKMYYDWRRQDEVFTDEERIYKALKALRSHGATVSEVKRHNSKYGFYYQTIQNLDIIIVFRIYNRHWDVHKLKS